MVGNRGHARRDSGDLEGALADAERAIKLDPRFADAYHLRGMLHFRKQNLEQAVADIDRAIEFNPRLAAAYGNRGFIRLLQGQEARAQEDFDQCIRLDPALKPRLDQWTQAVKQSRGITR